MVWISEVRSEKGVNFSIWNRVRLFDEPGGNNFRGNPNPLLLCVENPKNGRIADAVKIILLRRTGGGGRYYFPLMMFVEPAMKGGLKFWVWMNFLCSYENDRNTIGPYSLLLKQYKKSTKWFILTWNYCRGTMEGAAEIEPSSCLSHNFLL